MSRLVKGRRYKMADDLYYNSFVVDRIDFNDAEQGVTGGPVHAVVDKYWQ